MSADDSALMRAVLEQMAESEFKLDYEKIAAATGAPTVNAARVRWSRLKEKMKSGSTGSATPSKPTGVTKRTPKAGSAKKTGGKGQKTEGVDDADGAGGELVTPSKPARKRTTVKMPPKKTAAEDANDMTLGAPANSVQPEFKGSYADPEGFADSGNGY